MELTVRGQRAYAYTAGKRLEASLPTVVFVHGAELDHSCWALQSRWFANHGHNALAVDLPGHGRSSGAPLPDIATMADWLVALLDAADTPHAALVGHSMGSLAALDAAARYPQRIARLALLGCAAPMPVSALLLDAARDDVRRAEAMVNAWSHSPHGHIGGNRVPGMWMLGANRRLMARAAPSVLHDDLSACNNYREGIGRAAAVRCPVLLLCGERDQMTPPKAAQKLAKALPDVRMEILPGTGHAMMSEQPDVVLDALRGFLMEQAAA